MCVTAFAICVCRKNSTLTSQLAMTLLCTASRQTTEEEDHLNSLKAKNESLEMELSSLRRKIEEQDKLNGGCTEAEVTTERTEKKCVEELIAGTKSEEQQQNDDGIVEGVKKLKAEKAELEEKLAGLSTELDRYQHSGSADADTELSMLRDEKLRLDSLVTYLENEVQRHKDDAHEQRIRALDLKHELREVQSVLLCVYFVSGHLRTRLNCLNNN